VGGVVPAVEGAEELAGDKVAILGEDDGESVPVGTSEMVGNCDTIRNK
jgi:hypothetical protein